MSSGVECFLANREAFLSAMPSLPVFNHENSSSLALKLSRFVFSDRSTQHRANYIKSGQLKNPKEQRSDDGTGMPPQFEYSSQEVRAVYNECDTTFSLAGTNSMNPVLAGIKEKTPATVVNVDFSYVYLTSFECLKHVQRFKKVTSLCLQNCGLTEIPLELCKLPKALQHLDISHNYIQSIPTDVKWKGLLGLNLSRNAFDNWPSILQPDHFPQLTFLSLAFNNIAMAHNSSPPFAKLVFLDLSYCGLHSFPDWLSGCMDLKYLYLRGNEMIGNFTFNLLEPLRLLKTVDLVDVPINSVYQRPLPSLEMLIVDQRNEEELPPGNYCLLRKE